MTELRRAANNSQMRRRGTHNPIVATTLGKEGPAVLGAPIDNFFSCLLSETKHLFFGQSSSEYVVIYTTMNRSCVTLIKNTL